MIKGTIFKDHDNACALNATHTIFSDIPKERILEVFTKHGYNPKYGTLRHAIINSLVELGADITGRFDFHTYGIITKTHHPPTASKFARTHKGVWYVLSRHHAFAIIDGRIMDPYAKPMSRARIEAAFKIGNARPLKVNDEVKFEGKITLMTAFNPKKRGSYAYVRYEVMRRSVLDGRNDVAHILANTRYTKADLTHDVLKGFITVE